MPTFPIPDKSDECPNQLGRAVIVMGVAGSGKTTLGAQLARALSAEFHDADDFHDDTSVAKMRAGVPLSDTDRAPWLQRLNALLCDRVKDGTGIVLACSALRAQYRDVILRGIPTAHLLFLDGDFDTIAARIRTRSANTAHYMPEALLQSQFDTLEAPANAVVIDVALSPEAQLACALASITTSEMTMS